MRVMVVNDCGTFKVFFCFVFLSLFLLSSCMDVAPTDKIDPSGNMSRHDYIALRHRHTHKDKKKTTANDIDCDDDDDADTTECDTAPKNKTPPIPDLPSAAIAPSAPLPTEPKDKLVSLTVTDSVPLRDVLIELGREGGVNLELDPRISGGVIFTAHQQPFRQVLKRLCDLAGLRYRADGAFTRVELDEPYQQTYPLDYPSLSRRASSEVGIATNVFDVDVTNATNGTGASRTSSTSGSDNNSVSKISAVSEADFWSELEKSLTQVLVSSNRSKTMLSNAKDATPASGNSPSNFSLDKQAGLITVYANTRQHEAVASYLQRLRRKVSSQVLIEARIVEVELDDEYKSGINWRTLFGGAANVAARFGTTGSGAPFSTASTAANDMFTASLSGKDFSGILSLVRTFGTTRVLSSPRVTVLNNQTAVLKVARNEVYFVTSAQYATNVNSSGVVVSGTPVFSSTPRTVPVGLVMTVQPAIDNEHSRVTMTLRPTISRVVDRVNDPSIALNAAETGVTTTVQSQIPVLAVRELDSVLQLNSGEVAVMGGLMQDSSVNQDTGVPPFDTMTWLGELAKARDNNATTSELVILLRATILDNPVPDEIDADLYRRYGRDPRDLPMPKQH